MMGIFQRFFGARAGSAAPVEATPPVVAAEPAATPALPPELVTQSLARILRPQAAYRWLLPQLSSITPQYIETVLRGALAGNHVQQWELFDLMFDSWPELAACANELTDGVMERKLIFEAFAEEDEDATPTAQERCKLVSAALRRMMPDATADENDLDGTIRDILDGWFRGVTALEIDWQRATSVVHGNFIAPRATFWVHPVCFAFDVNGRLGLRVDASGQMQPMNLAGTSLQPQPAVVGAFPQHKFLIGIHKAKSGTALGGSLLRPLAWWWCAANFSADWLLNLAQVFGLPFRWANYEPHAPQATVDAICNMLQNMGSAGWAAFPAGTTLELKEATKEGGDHSPQGELLDRADRYARLVILGQTMSGSQDASKGGGKAFGAVESDVKERRINAAAKYACSVLNTQLIPSILVLNYGDADEAPRVRLLDQDEGGLDEAKRDQVLAASGLEIPTSFLRKKYGLPEPRDGEDVIGGKADTLKAETLKEEAVEVDEEVEARELQRLAGIADDALFAAELRRAAEAVMAREAARKSAPAKTVPGTAIRGQEAGKAEKAIRGRSRTVGGASAAPITPPKPAPAGQNH
jgi:phage gp29-like protein